MLPWFHRCLLYREEQSAGLGGRRGVSHRNARLIQRRSDLRVCPTRDCGGHVISRQLGALQAQRSTESSSQDGCVSVITDRVRRDAEIDGIRGAVDIVNGVGSRPGCN